MEKIFYTDIDSPMGPLWAAQSNKGLIRLNLPCTEQKFLKELAPQIKKEPEYRPSKLDELSLWLEDYFKRKKHHIQRLIGPKRHRFPEKSLERNLQDKLWQTHKLWNIG